MGEGGVEEKTKAIIRTRGEAGSRRIAADLNERVRDVRGSLLQLVNDGAVETIRRRDGARTRVFYRLKCAAGD